MVLYILAQYFRGFAVVWKRQEEYELVLVIILYILLLYVSHEHVLVCITRKVTRSEIDMDVVWVIEIDGISVWGIGVDFISV